MTVLEAVNQVLESIGEPAVTELDSGGTSEASEAEDHLGRASYKIQGEGWAVNTTTENELTVPDVKLTTGVAVGTFVYGETVTQATSGATGTFAYELSGYVYLRRVSGTFDGTHAITGGTSAATRAISAYAAVTEARIPINRGTTSRWLTIKPDGMESRAFVPVGDYLYDRDNNTFTWDESVLAEIVAYVPFADLPDSLANAIVAEAKLTFQRFKRRGQFDEQLMASEVIRCKTAARQEDGDLRAISVLDTREALRMRGGRNRSGLGSTNQDFA